MKRIRKKSALRDYRSGTFDKRVAYGQRERKLTLVARGIMPGFRVLCKTENSARNLGYSLRVRAARIELADFARFGLKVKVEGRKVYVRRTRKLGLSNQPA
jgi:hypothetical protein